MGLVLTCHSKILVCHWLFLARAALEKIKKQNKKKKLMNPRNLSLEVWNLTSRHYRPQWFRANE